MNKHIQFTMLALLSSFILLAQPRESLTDRVRNAFSLVGRWEILKMQIDRSETVTNPNTVPEAALAQATVTVKSELGSYGYFDVAPGGSITGEGEVAYQYRVAAGSSAFSMGPVPLAIGAVAMMNNDNGLRKFTITGNADLSNRTIALNAFQPQGRDLQMIIRPGGRAFTSVLWPPMSNVGATKVIVAGSSLYLRATGVIQGIKVTLEAVKYVDLARLFDVLGEYIDDRVTYVINRGPNTTNNNTGGPTNTSNTTTNNEQPGGNFGLVAGTINVPGGQTLNVTFRVPQVSANYAISLTPMNTNTNVQVSYSNKTTTGFKVHVTGGGTAPVKIDWLITPYTN